MHALIVGGSGGVGGALADLMLTDPAVSRLTVWQRRPFGGANDAAGKRTTQHINLLDEATIAMASDALGDVDLVIVASGLLHDEALGIRPEKTWRTIDPDAMRRNFEINTIGPALVAKHVLPHLPRDSRAVFAVLSARVGSISDNRLGGWYSYRASKAALNSGYSQPRHRVDTKTAPGDLRRIASRHGRHGALKTLPRQCCGWTPAQP